MTAGARAGDRLATGDWLAAERERVETAFRALTPGWLAAVRPSLRPALDYALSTRGKRLRPVLCVAAWRTVGGEGAPAAIYRLACAPELVHTYSLVHDDLPCMDDDDLRRGRPTTHRVHGVPMATVAGASLLPLAAATLVEQGAQLGMDAAGCGRLVAELCRAAGAEGMVGGQLLDLEGENCPVDGATLERIHRAKTGALLAASLRLGAIAGGAGEDALAALSRYGDALGLAFQIVDDVLDVTAESAALGKTAGRDVALAKASYAALHGVEGARRLARQRVDEARAAVEPLDAPQLAAIAEYVLERTH